MVLTCDALINIYTTCTNKTIHNDTAFNESKQKQTKLSFFFFRTIDFVQQDYYS